MTQSDARERAAALATALAAKLPAERVPDAVLFGSAAIALRGVDLQREVGDLDVFVSGATYRRLKTTLAEVRKENGVTALASGVPDVEILDSFPGVEHARVLERAMPLSGSAGFRVAALDDLIAWKRAQGRPKDLADLAKMGTPPR